MIEKRGNRTWYRSAKSYFKIGKKGRVVHVVAAMAVCLSLTFITPALEAGLRAETITDARTATHTIANTGDSVEVTNTGSITVTNAVAIDATANGLDSSRIINKGQLLVTKTVNDIVVGIRAGTVKNSSLIENSGLIQITDRAGGQGNRAISVEELFNSSIINSGMIQVKEASVGRNYGIYVKKVDTTSTITNAGTISLTSSFHADTLDYNSNPWFAGIGTYDTNATNQLISNTGTISIAVDSCFNNFGISAQGDTPVTNGKNGIISISTGNAMGVNGMITTGAGDATNEGTISVSADSARVCGIVTSGTGLAINSGTISVSVDPGTLSLMGMTLPTAAKGIATYGGNVTNSGTITAATRSGALAEGRYSVYAYEPYTTNVGSLTNTGTL
ncbi:MAG: hypothetical protein KKC20_00565, partial [Proteobacteria bacterium]|nr:hypothetical protein [Pseudomonadota bacterium]